MRAFVGLISRPVDVKSLSADAITFIDRGHPYAPGMTMTIEIANSSGSVVRLLQIQIFKATPQPGGACQVNGTFSEPLSDDDLEGLRQ